MDDLISEMGDTFDALDLHIAEAICVDALGVDDGPWMWTDEAGIVFHAAAVDALRAGSHPNYDCTPWLIQAAPPLAVELITQVGWEWAREVDVAVDLAVVRRCERMADIAVRACGGRPVRFDTTTSAVALINAAFPSVELLEVV